MKIAVVYATLGRPEIVAGALDCLQQQTRQPDSIVISAVTADDVPKETAPGVTVVFGPKGLPAQRNTGLREVGDAADIVIFFDDDYAPTDTFLERLEAIFARHPDIVGVTGAMAADGIKGPGYTFEDARRILAGFTPDAPGQDQLKPVHSLYGCNMAIRMSAAKGLVFDEALPLYAWQEDVDYTMQLARNGRLVHSTAIGGVHLGVKRSRTPGQRMGYMQIANPVFLLKKRTMLPGHAYKLMAKNMIANTVRSLAPEPWCDRRGRLAGNFIALGDLVRGKLHPGNALRLK